MHYVHRIDVTKKVFENCVQFFAHIIVKWFNLFVVLTILPTQYCSLCVRATLMDHSVNHTLCFGAKCESNVIFFY